MKKKKSKKVLGEIWQTMDYSCLLQGQKRLFIKKVK